MKRVSWICVVCVIIKMVACADFVPTLTSDDKTYMMRMHEQFCGAHRMCSKSSNTEHGECELCSRCRCDTECDTYGDCCADKALEFLDSPNFHPTRYHCHSNAFKLIQDRKPEFSFHSIQKCSLRTDDQLVKLCENPDPLNISLAVPAQSGEYLYRNQFCAACNGKSEYVLWEIKAECTQLVWLNRGMTSLQIIQSFVDNPACAVFLRPKEGLTFRPCYTPEEAMISDCEHNDIGHAREAYEKLCHAYTAPIHLFEKVYRNIFCYMCNYGSLDDSFVPSPGCPFDTPYPFSVILNPELLGIARKSIALSCECDPGYVYDVNTDECREIECTSDRILMGEVCFSVIRSANGLVYLLEVMLKPSSTLKVKDTVDVWIPRMAGQLSTQLREMLGGRFIRMGTFRVGVHVKWDMLGGGSVVESISIHTKFGVRKETEINEMETMLLELRQSDWTVEIDSESLVFTAEPFWTDPDDNRTYSTLKEEVIDEEQSVFRLDHGSIVDLTKGHEALYVADTLKCPRVKVFEDVDYSFHNDTGQWQLIGSNATMDITEFEPSRNGSGFVCYTTFRGNVTNCGRSESLSPAPAVEGPVMYVTLVCQAISLICLSLTFLVFCIFKSLRDMTGKNTMGFILTHLLALLIYSVSSTRTEHGPSCKATGITIHFLLLSSFTWMSICAVHLYIVFRNLFTLGDPLRYNMKRFAVHVVVSVLAPVVVVGASVAGNHFSSDGQDLGYGEGVCHVSNFYSALLGVGAPIVLVIIISGSLFIAAMSAMKHASKQQNELKNVKRSIGIYVQLSVLAGISWFFAIASVLDDLDIFKYVFAILCAIFGIFILVTFICTKRVLYLFRDCCKNTGVGKADDIKVKMTFNGGADLDFEDLEKDQEPDYADIQEINRPRLSLPKCIADFHKARLSLTSEDLRGKKGVHNRCFDEDSLITEGSVADEEEEDKDKQDKETHEVDMHNAARENDYGLLSQSTAGRENDYGLLSHSTTKEIKDPHTVMFNPVFK